jgi:hypothetical protein
MKYLLIFALLFVSFSPAVAQRKSRTLECNKPRLMYIERCDLQHRVCQNGWRTPEQHRRFKCDQLRRREVRRHWAEENRRRNRR